MLGGAVVVNVAGVDAVVIIAVADSTAAASTVEILRDFAGFDELQ